MNEFESDKIIYDLIIIGCGSACIGAGLTLQNELSKNDNNNYRILLIEGRDRVGGRALTNNELGIPIDLGASWIHHYSIENPLYSIADEILGSEYNDPKLGLINGIGGDIDHNNKSIIIDYDGSLFPISVYNRSKLIVNHLMQISNNYRDLMLNQLNQKRLKLKLLDDIEEFEWEYNELLLLDSTVNSVISNHYNYIINTESSQCIRCINYLLKLKSQYEASSFDKLSAISWNYGSMDSGLTNKELIVNRGYGRLIEILYKKLKYQIRFNTIVNSIDYTKKEYIILNCINNNNTISQKYYSKQLLLTIPLGILQSNLIKFNPILPKYKLDSINRFGNGLMNKIILQFPYCFWDNLISINYISNLSNDFQWILSIKQQLNKSIINHIDYNKLNKENNNILIFFLTDQFAKEIELLSDIEIINRAMDILKLIFIKRKLQSTNNVKSSINNDNNNNNNNNNNNHFNCLSTECNNNTLPIESDSTLNELDPIYANKLILYESIPNPINYIITRWGLDLLSGYGSYSHYGLYCSRLTVQMLAKSIENRIHFAGEYTNNQSIGCVDSAYESGIKAAKIILMNWQ